MRVLEEALAVTRAQLWTDSRAPAYVPARWTWPPRRRRIATLPWQGPRYRGSCGWW